MPLDFRCLLKTDEIVDAARARGFPFKKGTLHKYKYYGVIEAPLVSTSEGPKGFHTYYPDYVVDELMDICQLKEKKLTLDEIKEIIAERRTERREEFLKRLDQEEDKELAAKAKQNLEERLGKPPKVSPLDAKKLEKRQKLAVVNIQRLESYNDRMLQMLELITEQISNHIELNKAHIELLREIQ